MTYSAAFVVCAGRDDAQISRRAAAISRELDELRSNSPLVGTPARLSSGSDRSRTSVCSGYTCSCWTYPISSTLRLFADEVNRQL